MPNNNNHDHFNGLIDDLMQEAKRPLSLNATFKNKLRGRLLNQYEQSPISFAVVGRWAGTAVALTLLIFAIFTIRQMMSSNSPAAETSAAPAAAPVSVTRPAIESDVIYDHLLISWQTSDGMTVPITAESWQTADGNNQFRGQVSDSDGNLLHLVQNDGATLWRTYQAASAPGWQPVSQIYQSSAANYQPPTGETVPEWVTQPPFYSGLAWEGLVSAILQPSWECTDYPCVIDQLHEPMLGILPPDAESGNYGLAGSLIDTEIGENGRSVATLRIDFAPNASGEVISQYRQVKVDAETFAVLEVTDFDGDSVRRHLERVERETLPVNTLPNDFFSSVPDSLQVLPWQPQADTQDFVWLISASPAPETNLSSPSAPRTIELEIGYELVSAAEALLFVEMVPEDWNVQTSGFPPNIGNSGEWFPISAENSSITVPIHLVSNAELKPASIVANIKLILREPNTAYFFHQETLTASRWLLAEEEEVEVETAVATTEHASNDVWLISATQLSRISADDPITLIIDVAYQLESNEEVILKPLYAHPEWEMVVGGRSPIGSLGDEIVLNGKSGNQTIAFVEDPAIMREIVGIDQPVLVMQLGYLVEHEDSPRELKILAMPTLTGFAIDLTNAEKITYQIDLSNLETVAAAVISGTGGNGLTLRSTPNGQDIGILEEDSIVLLLDEPLQKIDGLFWQAVSTTIGKGWVVAEFLSNINSDPANTTSPHINFPEDVYHFEP